MTSVILAYINDINNINNKYVIIYHGDADDYLEVTIEVEIFLDKDHSKC